MNKPEKCKNCQWYGKPYWSIINPCDSCSRNEETTLVYKINMPMFQDGELERFDDNIHNISSEFVKMHLKEKDMILSQRLVKKLEEENTELQDRIDKARKYIKENCIFSDEWTDLGFCNFAPTGRITYKQLSKSKVQKLLDILKGGKNE